ncbi:hypothetical protein J3R83DRAFT_1036 [Lanmaoa asiatica]|nr:hypothetical protein J3R83DRAFT_1036 [Lanmaoa asiatica]
MAIHFVLPSFVSHVRLPLLLSTPQCQHLILAEIDQLLVKERDYIARIDELSTSLGAFRAAYTSSQDELKRKADESAALLAELHALKGHEKRVICLLDGDGTIFTADLITKGQEGGLEAARLLTERIRHHIAFDLAHEKFHLWVYLFYNKRGLLETFARVALSAAKQKLDDFIIGFNQAAERFLIVDVGGSKEAADAKIKVHLQDNIRLPQTHRIIFGGSHDNGYVNVLRSVITEGFRDKLILMPGYSDVALDIKALMLPELRIPDLFMTSKLVPPSYISIASGPPPGLPITPRLAASNPQISNSSITSITPARTPADFTDTSPRRNSIQSYKSALQIGRNDPFPYEPSDSSGSTDANDVHPAQLVHFTRRLSSPGKRRLNPKLPLSKHNPAPCTLFYLAQCRHGSDCKYGHDYLLDEEDYQELSENAKKTPCKITNEGGICGFGDDCVYGHVCPQGTTCYYLKLGKCKFQADAGHHPGFHSLKRLPPTFARYFLFTLLAFIMATPQVTEALIRRSRFLLARDETITRLLTLSSTTIKRNVDLENRLAELEVELAVWKQAHATALEGAEREAKALKGRLASLNSQIISMESLMSQSLLILCVVDGDACVFTEALLRQGHEGGRQAAHQLTKAVADYLTSQDIHVLGQLSFWITIYYNRIGLTSVLERHQLCTPEQLEAFTMGFSQASPRFLLVDVGYGKDATFTKITEYLQTYIRFPQTQRIFLAGGSDSAYASTIAALQSDGLVSKLAFIEAAGAGVNQSPRLRLPTLYVDNLFMTHQTTPSPSATHHPPPLNVTGLSPSHVTGGLPTPRSPPSVPTPSTGKLIDPNLATASQTFSSAL